MKKFNIIVIFLFLANYSIFAQTFDESMITTKIANNLVDVFKNQINAGLRVYNFWWNFIEHSSHVAKASLSEMQDLVLISRSLASRKVLSLSRRRERSPSPSLSSSLS